MDDLTPAVTPEASAAVRGLDRRLTVVLGTLWLIVAAFGASVILLGRWPEVLLGTDFVSFWTGANLVRDGAGPDLFDMRRQQLFQQGIRLELGQTEEARLASRYDPFHSPPPLALLFLPLTAVGLPTAYLIWNGLSLASFLAAVVVHLRGATFGSTKAVLLLSYAGVSLSLLEGQVNGAMLLAFSLGLWSLVVGRPLLGGALLGLLWLKPQYAVLFALVFLLKRRWRELAGMVAIGVAVAVLSVAMVGVEGLLRYSGVLREIGAFYPPTASRINPEVMANWRALVMNLWPDTPEATGSLLVLLLGGTTALASLPAWRGPWEPGSARFPRQMLVTSLAALVASPHSHLHGTVLLLAPLTMVLATSVKGTPLAWVWYLTLAAGYLVALTAFPLRQLSWLLVPCFLLGMGALTLQCRAHARSPRVGDPARLI